MGRSIIAVVASLFLLCAALLGVAAPLRAASIQASLSPSVAMINTDDGVSLDESVIDDLRPSALQDSPASSPLIDQLPASAWPAWGLAAPLAVWGAPGAGHRLPWPCLASPLRPPSAA